jgi:hypothetical protein
MRQYKVIDDRNRYRNDPDCEIKHDNEKMFVVNQQTTDNQGNNATRILMLNPSKFQEERIVNEQEAILLMLKGIQVNKIEGQDEKK